jgi:hypothetical protein
MKKILFSMILLAAVQIQGISQTYCAGGPSSTFDSEIASVVLNGNSTNINYNIICPGTTGLNLQTSLVADLTAGNNYSVAVGYGTCGGNFNSLGTAYIDFNGNGIFEPSEAIGQSPSTLPPFNATYPFTVPPGATPGITRMRVIQWESGIQPLPLDPCAGFIWGSVIDFGINIIPSGPCTAATADTAFASKGVICVGDSTVLGATGVSFGTGIVYQWQSSADNINWTNVTGANTVTYNTGGLTASTYYRLQVTCGANTATSTSTFVDVVGTPLAGGTYTLNSAVPTGGTNYQTFADFTGAVFCGGVAGPVILNVVPGSGPYNEQVIWSNLNTTSTNTITVNGNGEVLTSNAITNTQRGIFILENTSHITIDSLTISAPTGFPATGYGIQLLGASNNNTIRNCFVNFDLSITGFNTAGIHLGSNATSATIGGATVASNNLIENNTVIGSYYALCLIGGSNTNRAFGNQVLNNNFQDYHLYGIYSRNQNGLIVFNNEFHRPNRTTLTSFYGMFFTGEHENAEIYRNAIHDPFTSGRNASLIYAMYMTTASGTATNPNRVYNNILYNLKNNGTLYGIWTATSSHWHFYHNTIDINDTAAAITSTFTNTAGLYMTGLCEGLDFRNNIISVVRSGSGPKRAIWNPSTGAKTINNNGYWIDLSFTPAEFADGFATFGAWAAGNTGNWDNASVFDFPDFVSAPTGLLRPRSGAMNNIGTNLLTLVPVDFLDTPRTATPDPGAFEFNPPPCPRPSVNLVGTTDTSASITWFSGIAGGTYNIEWGPVGFTRGTGNFINMTGDTLNLNGLPNGTCYDIYVQLDCSGTGGGFSSWSFVFTFCTDACDVTNTCLYTFRMTDSWGDGWNGNTMAIRQAGVTVATIGATFTTGTGPVDVLVPLCTGPFDLFWNPGGSFSNEVGIEVLDPFNNSMFAMPFNSQALQNTTIYSGLALCGPINCSPPTQFTLGGTTDSSASFTWIPGSNGIATFIEYGPVGFTVGTGTRVFVPAIPGVITGLTANTTYEAYILDTCVDGTQSPAIGPRVFKTACLAETMPYTQLYTTWPVPCWTNQSLAGNMLWEHYNTGGVDYAQARFWSFNAPNTAAFTSVPINITTDAQVRFNWARNTSTFYADSMFVLSKIAGTATWDTLMAYGDPNFGVPNAGNTLPPPLADFKDELFYLPNSYVGNAAEIRFVGKSAWGPNVYMDYFIVEAQPPCPDPTQLTSNNVTATSVGLAWNQFGSGINTWEVEWGPVGFTPGTGNGTIVSATTNPYTLGGLSPGACIDIYVRADCNAANNGYSLQYAGPVTVCLPWQNDIAIDAMVNPTSPTGCGDSAMAVSVAIFNNGQNPASGIPLRANISGFVNTTLNTTYAGPLAPGATDTIVIGTINSYTGGYLDFELVNLWANDQNSANDTLEVDSVLILPAEPQVQSAFVCGNPDSVDIVMQSFPGANYAWYDQQTGGNLLTTGNSFRVPSTNLGPYYVEYQGGVSGSLATLNTGGSGCGAGNMFDLVPSKNLSITGFDIRPFTTSPTHSVQIYMVTGSFNSLSGQAGWTLVHSTTINATVNVLARVNLPNPVALQANQTYGFYVNHNASYTVGANTFSNADLAFISGNGNCAAFDYCCDPRTFNGEIHYEVVGCTTSRVPVSATIYQDTAFADFTANEVSPGSFNFDGTNSVGDLYSWDFGDGGPVASGPGLNITSHTYLTSGAFTVTLTVTDTVCNTTDIKTMTVNSTISLEEFLINQRLLVYPNPSRAVFNVEFELQGVRELYLRLMSPTGQLIFEDSPVEMRNIYKREIDLSRFAKGVYILQVQTESGVVSRRLTLM